MNEWMKRKGSPGDAPRKAVSYLLVGVGMTTSQKEGLAPRIAEVQVDKLGRVFQVQFLVYIKAWKWKRGPRVSGDWE